MDCIVDSLFSVFVTLGELPGVCTGMLQLFNAVKLISELTISFYGGYISLYVVIFAIILTR